MANDEQVPVMFRLLLSSVWDMCKQATVGAQLWLTQPYCTWFLTWLSHQVLSCMGHIHLQAYGPGIEIRTY
eukprot:2994694-Amphidinium_carterae.1